MLVQQYLDALKQEARCMQSVVGSRSFATVYLGGGTPTLLDTEALQCIADTVHTHFFLADDAEITIEANPHTLTADKLHGLASWGVNRLSIGMQSLNDRLLAELGRPHSARDAVAAMQTARDAGFDNIGIDVMYGIPGQTREHWQETLEGIAALKPEHISAYALSLDEGSQFHCDAASGRLTLPEEDNVADMYYTVMRYCAGSGYGQYELSNFCRPGRECRHNANYWARGEYLGLGPGAWSFLDGVRRQSVASVQEYADRLAAGVAVVEEEDRVDREQEAAEFVMLQLRTSRGIDLALYRQRYGVLAGDRLLANMAAMSSTDLLEATSHRLFLSERGKALANEAIARLTA